MGESLHGRAATTGGDQVAVRIVFRACVPLCIFLLAAGCGSTRRNVKTAEVSGKVLLAGEPLPGGRLTFVKADGQYATSALILEDGTYSIKAPLGEVQISIDNRDLREKKKHPILSKRPGAKEPEPVKGTYTPIPKRYYMPASSGLTYTVREGSQEHDVLLDKTGDY